MVYVCVCVCVSCGGTVYLGLGRVEGDFISALRGTNKPDHVLIII